jgi:Tol biopolymer transport system component
VQGAAVGQPLLVKQNLGRFLPMGITRTGSYYYGLRSGSRDVYIAPVDWEKGGPAGEPILASGKLRGANTSPVWSRDGKYLAFLSRLGTENFGQETRAITIRSADTGEERILTPKLAYLEKIEWSPDGRSLLMAGSDGKTRGGLFTIEIESGDERPLLRDHAASFRGFDGVWSADGKAVFYIRDEGEGSEIHRLDAESHEERMVFRPDPAARLHALAISPQGKSLAFAAVSPQDQAETVYLLSVADASTQQLLKLQRGGVAEIEWSPDGRALLLAGGNSLWQAPIDGSGAPRQLQLEISGDGGFSAHPDGRRLAYIAGETQAEVWVIEDFLPGLHAAR